MTKKENSPMAGGSDFVWILLLVTCIFHASDSRHVQRNVGALDIHTGNADVAQLLSQIPITLPDGIDPRNINITSIHIRTCTDRLTSLNKQLQQTSLQKSQLDEEAFMLRGEVRQLKLQLATCSSTASAITSSYQTQLQLKLKQQLEIYDNDAFLILKVLALTSEVITLQKKVRLAANSNGTADIRELQRELEGKTAELNAKKQQIEDNLTNSALILQIISLQSQIWDLQQSRRADAGLQFDKKSLDLQEKVDRKISELRGSANVTSAMLELISVRYKIVDVQRRISVHIEESRTNVADVQRQRRLKVELLKKKILLLNRDEKNSKLTNEILLLQVELGRLEQLMRNASKTTDFQLRELRVILEEERRRQISLQKQLEEADYAQAQLIMNIISIMEEVREKQQTTSTGQTKSLWAQLQAKEKEYAKAQTEIRDLQRKLQLKIEECSRREDKYEKVKTEYEQKIAELNRTGDSTAALILDVVKLHDEVKALREEISTSEDKDMISALQRQLEKKQRDLDSKTADIERLVANPRIVLTIIELQDEIWDLQKKDANSTTSGDIKQLQDRLNGLIGEIDDQDGSNTQLMLRIVTLQSQVKYLEKLLSNLQMPQNEITQLTNDLTTQKKLLEKYVNELNEKNQTNAELILNISDLHIQLRNLENEKQTEGQKTSATVSKLREQLKIKEQEHSRDQDVIKDLQNKLNQTEGQCSDSEQKIKVLTIIKLQGEIWDLQKKGANGTTSGDIKQLQDRLNGLIGEIDDGDGSNKKLILNISDLYTQLRNLENEKQTQGQTTSATVSKLREQLKNKEQEHSRDQDVIKDLQNKLKQTEGQCSDSEQKIKDLQNKLDDKMKELQSKSDTVTSLALQISTLTVQLEELKRQLENTVSKSKVEELQKNIDEKTKELDKKTEELRKRSSQPQRLLQIIAIQTEIEKLVHVAANDTDYNKIRAHQDHLDYLISGIQDEDTENTKLMFQFLAQRDEIARLKKQEESQIQAQTERIKDLEDELRDIRNQIKEKTLMLDSSDMTISNQTAQIMELHEKIKPLEAELSDLKECHAENLAELQERLNLTSRRLQVSELQLQKADAKNFNLITEVADLRAQLKKAQKQASKAAGKNIKDLEQQLKTQQRENAKLERANKDLTQDVIQLRRCCSDVNTQCDDLQRQLQQSQEDADRLQQQLNDKDAKLKHLEQELEEQTKENNQLQHERSNLESQLRQTMNNVEYQQQQLHEKDARLRQLEQELQEQTKENDKLLEDYNNLQTEKNKLEDDIQELQRKLAVVEDTTIYAKKVTFDPDTANPRVVLSADNTEMSTTDSVQNVPDHPGRFDVTLGVLGATGYSTGRHYWEVSVAGKNCFLIGMASESSPRKGSLVFNPTNGFWTIVLNKQGQYRALDRRAVTILTQRQPLTLGILLDYKKGQISFYDSGARSHLYTFVGQRFTDKIYPFINFCVDADNPNPIVLLAPGSVDWIK